MRYMLLHELQPYRHKDAIANYLMNFAGVLYWFNPFVWFGLKVRNSSGQSYHISGGRLILVSYLIDLVF